jgi:hypothetical protein
LSVKVDRRDMRHCSTVAIFSKWYGRCGIERTTNLACFSGLRADGRMSQNPH